MQPRFARARALYHDLKSATSECFRRKRTTSQAGGETVFLLGAIGYPIIELCWRRRTHPSMALAGGLAATGLGHIRQTGRPLWQQALLGGLWITGVEYTVGLIFNRRYQVWDYRRTPLNVRGQICVPYTAAWCVLSAAVLGVSRARG